MKIIVPFIYSLSVMESKQLVAQAQATSPPLTLQDRQRAALLGLYIGDAVAMPVHWMYDLRNLKRDYGEVKGYMKPLEKF